MRTDGPRARLTAAGLLALCVLAAGCGGPPRAQVQGTITLDGASLEGGMIEFTPEAGDGPTAAVGLGPGGKYALDAPTGRMIVRIEANKVTGQRKVYNTPDSPMTDIVVSLVPPEYNKKSDLRTELKAGPNECNFELKTKK